MDALVTSSIEEAFQVPIRGWDFSWLQGRAHETPPPWSYTGIVRAALEHARVSLDIDTGGGEFIERLAPVPGFLVATEGYAPNVPVAARRLAPLGVAVVQASAWSSRSSRLREPGSRCTACRKPTPRWCSKT
jgi:hypothetical protein